MCHLPEQRRFSPPTNGELWVFKLASIAGAAHPGRLAFAPTGAAPGRALIIVPMFSQKGPLMNLSFGEVLLWSVVGITLLMVAGFHVLAG